MTTENKLILVSATTPMAAGKATTISLEA